MRIAFVISSLGAGGAERVVSSMANYWAARGQSVVIVTLATGDDFYRLDSRVERRSLGLPAASSNLLQALVRNIANVMRLRAAIIEISPDVVISFIDQTNVLTLLATRKLPVAVVVSERIDPAVCPIKLVWQLLRRLCYRWASRVVVQTERAADYFSHSKTRIAVIPNAVDSIDVDLRSMLPRPCVVGMGRLTRQKGFDLLMRAFCQIADRHTNWRLVVIGDGEMRDELEELAYELGIERRVTFTGNCIFARSLLAQADIFVLSSRFEGFPNALCEAMAASAAVISFDCRSGPAEIIQDDVNGLLVPAEDVGQLAKGIERLMIDEELRERLGGRAIEVVMHYSPERVMARWEDVINAACPEVPRAGTATEKQI